MSTERFSMNHYVPPSYDEKIYRVEQKLRELEDEREPLVDRKREIELQLTEVNGRLIDKLPIEEFTIVSKTRQSLTKEKFDIEEKIRDLLKKRKPLLAEKDELTVLKKRSLKSEIEKELILLRDKYMSFSSDTTRVSSMRAMSSRFVEEIQQILKILK